MKFWPPKDPDELLDYDIDWSERLVTDTIVASTWTADTAGITIVTDSTTSQTTKIWLDAGVEAAQYVLTNQIITAGGRTMEESVKLRIKSR